mgnify:CR=1 FL=1
MALLVAREAENSWRPILQLSQAAKDIADKYNGLHVKSTNLILGHLLERGNVKRGSLFDMVARFDGLEYVVFLCGLFTFLSRPALRMEACFIRSWYRYMCDNIALL